MAEPCQVLPSWSTTCDRGTVGCDACERCTCHGCYSHSDCTCAYQAARARDLDEVLAGGGDTTEERR